MKKNRSKNHLEEFIRENRRELDREEPGIGLWEEIESRLDTEKPVVHTKVRKLNFTTVHWAAAALLLLLTASVVLNVKQQQMLSESPVASAEVGDPMKEIAPELYELQQQYFPVISARLNELHSLNPGQYNLGNIDQELEDLEVSYEELRKTLLTEQASEMIINSMIENLKIRADILNSYLETIQKIKNENHETVNI